MQMSLHYKYATIYLPDKYILRYMILENLLCLTVIFLKAKITMYLLYFETE